MGLSGNGLVERMNAGRNPCGMIVIGGGHCPFQKAVSRSKENAAVERREVNAQRYWACAARRIDVTRAFRRSAPLTFVRESSPLVSEGMEIPALPAPCENRGGGALGFFVQLFDR